MRARHLTPLATLAALVGALLLVPAAPAGAAARVTVTNELGSAKIDATYTTTLTLRGAGFRSIDKGFGGIYVLFGTVSGSWRPSAHGNGSTLYVPDSETRSNAGHQRFVAFPGGETADSANGGTLGADGRWSTAIKVPGATFQAVGSDNKVVTVDCRKVTCGVITIGAHGVANSANETFTPVRVADLYGKAGSTTGGTTPDDDTAATSEETTDGTASTASAAPATRTPGKARAEVAPALQVDRASAGAGKILAFSAVGMSPGAQVSAVLDDGEAGAGPFVVGAQGQVAGLLQVPDDAGPGTHELRLVGVTGAPSVRFAVTSEPIAPVAVRADETSWQAKAFVGVAVALLVAALLFVVRRLRRRHAAA